MQQAGQRKANYCGGSLSDARAILQFPRARKSSATLRAGAMELSVRRPLEIRIDLLDQLIGANRAVAPARIEVFRRLGGNRFGERLAVLDEPGDAVAQGHHDRA